MRDQMNTRLRGYALVVLICSFAPQAMAQRWLTELPQQNVSNRRSTICGRPLKAITANTLLT